MQAEMPIKDPQYSSRKKGKKKDLKYTVDLALKERGVFESRLEE